MISFRFIMITILLALLCPISLHSQTAPEYYKHGLELKKQNKIDEAIEALKKAVAKDRKFAEAYYELALLYRSKKTPASLKRAEDAILAAKKYGDDDVKYLSALALINEDRNFDFNAKLTYDRVLKIDPDNIEALAGIARIYANDAKNIKNRVDYNYQEINNLIGIEEWVKKAFRIRKLPIERRAYEELKEPILFRLMVDRGLDYCMLYPLLWDKNMLEYFKSSLGLYIAPAELEMIQAQIGEVNFDDFAAMDYSITIEYNRKILSLDPDNRDALCRLGLIYFDNNNLNEFAKLFEELILKYPDDKDGHLFLGLANYRMRNYDKAYEYYEISKGFMIDDERAVFSNVGYLKEGGMQETEIRATESSSPFWVQRDPLYLTQYNERQLEHYSRVAEANLRFSIPDEGIEGWQSDRGKILIKYGAPEKRKIFFNTDPGVSQEIKKFREKYYDAYGRFLNTDFTVDYFKHDYWYYPDFTFMFETTLGDEKNNYKLPRNF